jgi:hypothetical protein
MLILLLFNTYIFLVKLIIWIYENGYHNKMNGNENSGFESVEDLRDLCQIGSFIYPWE